MTVKEHYDNHLGHFYSWMAGDFSSKVTEFQQFLIEQKLLPQSSKIAIDLGAGHGIQTAALAKSGYSVKAIDFSSRLLDELTGNTEGLNVETFNTDIRGVDKFSVFNPELIVCCGDTIAHLDSELEIAQFIAAISKVLINGGKLLISFRDYSIELTGNNRFIPVKSDGNRILTCIVDYRPEYVVVTDLLYEKNGNSWEQKLSTYRKVRVTSDKIVKIIKQTNMKIQFNKAVSGMITIIACKSELPQTD